MKETRGHSNIGREGISVLAEAPSVARIEIYGGGNAKSVKRLPDLSLRYDEWITIGKRMNWFDGLHCPRCGEGLDDSDKSDLLEDGWTKYMCSECACKVKIADEVRE